MGVAGYPILVYQNDQGSRHNWIKFNFRLPWGLLGNLSWSTTLPSAVAILDSLQVSFSPLPSPSRDIRYYETKMNAAKWKFIKWWHLNLERYQVRNYAETPGIYMNQRWKQLDKSALQKYLKIFHVKTAGTYMNQRWKQPDESLWNDGFSATT